MASVSLDGLTLHVSDKDRSLAFYTRLPGATDEVHQPGVIGGCLMGSHRRILWKMGIA